MCDIEKLKECLIFSGKEILEFSKKCCYSCKEDRDYVKYCKNNIVFYLCCVHDREAEELVGESDYEQNRI